MLAKPRCVPAGGSPRTAGMSRFTVAPVTVDRVTLPCWLASKGDADLLERTMSAMSLISRLLHAVQSWRRRPGGLKTTKRAAVSMEQLDHRQLLSVNFTGNVKVDFPATQQPGVVVIPATAQSATATLPSDLASAIEVSGFTLSGIRVSYSASDDVLSIGLDQPPNDSTTDPNNPGQFQYQPGTSPYSVIAGDADNNGNDGTVSAGGAAPFDRSTPSTIRRILEMSETMGAFLDLDRGWLRRYCRRLRF